MVVILRVDSAVAAAELLNPVLTEFNLEAL
jgi:hypothetical protein